MSTTGLEKRIVQMLSCDPNRSILEKVVMKESKSDFQYIASEFPILTDEGYGFLDLAGRAEQQNLVVLLECKLSRSLLLLANEEAEYYNECVSKHGAVQTENLIGLYHRRVLDRSFDSNTEFIVKPLILDERTLLRHSGFSFAKLLSEYRNFMVEWVSSNYEISSQDITNRIPPDAIPIYLINRLEKTSRRGFVGVNSLTQPLFFLKLETFAPDAPLKLEPDKSTYDTMHRMELAGESRRFAIQFHRHGHSRPMLLFEVDDEFSACFVHTGRHLVELNGYYESEKVLNENERIYGLVQVETGRYSVKDTQNNRLTLQLFGNQSHGEVKLNFLDRIYIDEEVDLMSMRQTRLENH